MENKHARRISSLFSLNSSSADKSNGVSKSPSSLSLTSLVENQKNVQPPKIPTSPILIEAPIIEGSTQNGLSPAQTPQYEHGRLAPSPEPIVTSPDPLTTSHEPKITLPAPIVTSSELIVTSPELISTSPQEDFFQPTQNPKTLPEPTGLSTGSISEKRHTNRARSRTESTADGGADSTDERTQGSRSRSPSKFLQMANPLELRLSKRKSWLPGKSRSVSQGEGTALPLPQAWILSPHDVKPHDISALVNFQQVQELWDEGGDTTITLHSGKSQRGPSFKLDSACFASSRKLSSVAHGKASPNQDRRPSYEKSINSQNERVDHGTNHSRKPSCKRPLVDVSRSTSISVDVSSEFQTPQIAITPTGSPPSSPQLGSSANGSSEGYRRTISESYEEGPRQIHLHVPLPLQTDLTDPESICTPDDIETLVAIRNLFAFLVGRPLIATPRHASVFAIFLKIADFLQRYQFTNFDGSTLGEEAVTNFQRYLEDFKLADIRNSREKIIEAIVLGERMRSLELYNEGFVHGVGRYEEIIQLQSPKFHLITEITHQRMERATLDLSTRLRTVRTRLEGFEFPSLFSGIAQSTTSTESKMVRFKAWRLAYMSMRKHVISFYTHRYGAWPPKARSKKNDFEESGLNRVLLLELYQDFSNLYDILVDRNSLTTRSSQLDSIDSPIDVDAQASAPALRRVLGEFDRSLPPIQPPIPFDTPQLPSLAKTRRDYSTLATSAQIKERSKPLEYDEINMALMQSYNRDSIKSTSFLEAFMSYERKMVLGKSIDEIVDLRNGQWIFMYAVLQSLPLVVIDAPDVKWTEGVEYFLCEVPKGSAPWYQDDKNRKMGWYGIVGGTGVVSLPAELVEHGVVGIYRRSHCWASAVKWIGPSTSDSLGECDDAVDGDSVPDLKPLSPKLPDSLSKIPTRQKQRGSIHLGLEALPLPPGVRPSGSRPTSTHNPLTSFEDILRKK